MLLRLSDSLRLEVRFRVLLSKGRGTYFVSAAVVNSLRRLVFPAVRPASLARPFRLSGRRLLPPPRLESTSFRRLFISSFLLRPEVPTASAVSPSRPSGRGF